MMFFNVLVKSIFMYGVKIWGWQEREKLELLQVRCIRWTLGLDICAPKYVVQEETTTDDIFMQAGHKALKY